MNRIFRTLWSATRQCWQAVPENTKAASKGKSKTASGTSSAGGVASVILGFMFTGSVVAQSPPSVKTLPTGGVVAQGAVTISQTATAQAAAMTVNQSSQRAVVNWSTFNLGAAASVNFAQPNAQAVTLNRVSDANPSQIYGRITAPGQVFLSNPNGVYFSPTSQVDVGALTATTHSISDTNFMAGNYRFERNGATGKVVNVGNISAALGGYIALLAPEVQNAGVVVAQAGTVAMAAGDLITLNLNGVGGLASITTTPSTIASLVENKHAVLAPDGQIVLSAVALNKLQAGVVKNSGSLEANSLVNKGGKIVLEGDEITLDRNSKIEAKGPTGGGTVLVGGDWQGSGYMRQATKVTMEAGATIDASATDQGDGGKVVLWSDVHNADSVTRVNGSIKAEAGPNGGDGGKVETSGHVLNVDDIQVQNNAPAGEGGTWLLDPYDVTISSGATATETFTAGVYTPSGNNSVINATTLATNLNGTNGTVEIRTTGAGTQAGNISIEANLAWTTSAKLKLSASGGITTSNASSISSSGGSPILYFNQGADSTYSGVIGGGSLSFIKQGLGTLTLTGVNTFARELTLERGNVVLGAGGSLAANATYGTIKFGNTVDDSTFIFDPGNATTYVLNRNFGGVTGAKTGVVKINSGTVQTTASQIYDFTTRPYLDIAAGATFQKTDSSVYIQIAGLRGGGTLSNPYELYIPTFAGVTSTFSGSITGTGLVNIGGTGVQVFSGANTYTGTTNVNTGGTLRISNAHALGSTGGVPASTTTVDGTSTLEIDGGITVPEVISFSSGATLRSVSGANTLSAANTYPTSGTMNFKVDADSMNLSNGTAKNLTSTWNFFLTGNLNFNSAVNGGTLKKIGSGNLTYLSRTGTAVVNVTGVYVRLYDATGNYSSPYGTAPTNLTYGFYDAAVGGTLVNPTYTGAVAWTGTVPTATSTPATFPLTYASGLTVTSANYLLMGAGATTNWTVVPKPVTITLTPPAATYNGVTTYANLVSGTTYANTAMVGTDSLLSITKTATLVGGGAANGVAQGGAYVITPSLAVMKTGTASNYNFIYTAANGTVLKAPLTMTANDASILLGQGDPAFTARYTGFVNGETAAVLTTPTVTRFGADAAAGSYAGVLRPSATSNNYNIATVNGTFTIVPTDTLFVKVSDLNKTYGAAPNYAITSAEYLTAGNVVRTVNVTATGGGHFTYTDGLIPTPTTGSFDLSSAATANSDVNNYAITLSNFTKVGNNFTVATPSVQSGNLTVVPLAATLSPTLTVSKSYDGTTAATGAVSITNKVGTDDVSVSGTGEFTDNANAGIAHAYSVTGLTVSGAKASNYSIDPANLPALIGNNGVITPAALTLSTSNVVKTYDGSLSVVGATTAPALTVTSGTLYANASNGGVTDSVSGGTFAFTNANAGVGNKAVAVSNATVTDGNGGGNYTVSYANNTNSTINPAALTLSTSNVVKTYNGSLSVAGATTAPALTVTSGTLYANASNGGATDAVTGGNFAFTDANAGTGNKTVTVSGATFSTGSASNYNISYTNNTTSTINPAALTLSTSNVVKAYDGTLSIAGATTAPALTVTSGTLYSNASNGGATDAVTGGNFAFTDANAGTGNKTVTVAGATFSSGNANNYTISYANNNTSTINTATPTLTGLSNQNKTVGAANFTLAASSNSVGAVTYTSSDPTVATVNPATGEVTVVAAGNATITAAQAANGNYALGNATYTLTVSAAPPPAPPPAPPAPPAPPPNPALTNAEILALTPAQVAALTSNQLSLLTNAQMALFNASQLGAMTAFQIVIFTQAQIAGLTVSQIQTLSVSQLSALTPAIIASLSINQIASLSAAQIQSLTSIQLAALTAGQIATLSAANLAALTATQIGTLSSSQLFGLSGSQVAALSTQQLSGLTPTQLGGLSNSQLSSFSLQQAASLTGVQLAGLTPAQLALLIQPAPTPPAPPTPPVPPASVELPPVIVPPVVTPPAPPPTPPAPPAPVELPPVIVPPVVTPLVVAPAVVSMPVPLLTVPAPVFVVEPNSTNTPVIPTAAMAAASLDLTEMTTRQVALIPVQQVRQLSPAQIESMSGIQVRTLSPQQLGVMSSDQVAAFKPPQLQAMTTTQVASFAPEQLVKLQPDQIASFGVTQLKAMTPMQAQTLTPTQLSSLNIAQRAAVTVDTITIPSPETTLATTTQSTGVLPITVLDGGIANRATVAGVAFEQGPNSITLRSLDTPPAINTPRADMLAFNDKLTTFMVTSSVGELVEFQGSLIGNRLIIIASNNSARQVARAEMKLVLAAAITTLGREQRVMLAGLQGVVFDLR